VHGRACYPGSKATPCTPRSSLPFLPPLAEYPPMALKWNLLEAEATHGQVLHTTQQPSFHPCNQRNRPSHTCPSQWVVGLTQSQKVTCFTPMTAYDGLKPHRVA
jgi:hypothetical protein